MLRFLFSVVAATLLLGACSQTPPPPPPAPPAQRAMAPSQMPPATVYFATGSSTLSPESMATIQQVAANYKTTANATVTLTGHTDTVGSQDVNMALSQRRADAVRNALVREGVPAAAITAGGQGEASLPVQTADNVDERQNRSVAITVVAPIPMARTGMTRRRVLRSIESHVSGNSVPRRLTRQPPLRCTNARSATRRPAFQCSRER